MHVRKLPPCVPALLAMALLAAPPLRAGSDDALRRQGPPNAIRITGEELQGLLIGATADDPYGILSILSLKAGLTIRSTGDPGAENWLMVRKFGRDNSRLTLKVLDARLVNLSNNFTVEFDNIPVAIINSITVCFGPVLARCGGFHTVVEIRTAAPRACSGFADGAGGSQEMVPAKTVFEDADRLSRLANWNIDRMMGRPSGPCPAFFPAGPVSATVR